MLKHSVRFKKMGAALLVADATKLPLKSKSLSGIIASLGDPYNTDEFWREVARSLRPDGVCIFTTPAFEWSNAYRRSVEVEREDFAYFQLQDGRSLYVPSIIRPIGVQSATIERAGMRVLSTSHIYAATLTLPHSPKISFGSRSLPIVTGYLIASR